MKKIIIEIIIILVVAILVNVAAQAFAEAGTPRTDGVSLDIDSPKTRWRFKTQGPIRGDSLLFGDQVIFGSADGFIYSVTARSGTLSWKFNTQGAIVSTPAIKNKILVVSNRSGVIFGINASNGKQLWKFNSQAEIAASYQGWQYFGASPAISKNKVIVGSDDGFVYALNLKKGELLWKFNTRARIKAAALITKGKVYQPSNDGYIYVLDEKNGDLKTKLATLGADYDATQFGFDRKSIYAQPIKVNNQLIIAARDGNVHAFDLDNSSIAWSHSYGTTWAMSSVVDKNNVYVGWSTNNLLSAHSLKTGEEVWQFKAGAMNYTKPYVSDASIYFGSADGRLYRLNKKTGAKEWEYDVGSEIYSSPLVDKKNKSIIFGSDNGYLYAVENASKHYRAVYQPEKIEGNAQYLIVDKKITPMFIEKGYRPLDKDTLKVFVENRIKDKAPSVIVFALPIIPDAVMGDDPASGLLRQYLNTGGKVFWFGDVPNFYALNENGDFKRDASAGLKLLDVTYENLSESGNYYSTATQTGLNYGLPRWLKTTGTPVTENNIIPLARNEFGQVTAWIKKFNERETSGFVSLRTWAWSVEARERDLQMLYSVVNYGFE